MKISGNTILLTGGGGGIGRELARRWHDLDNTVIVAGRGAAALAETAAGYPRIHPLALDVSDPADIARFATEILQAHPALNVLVNNAGIMRFEDLAARRDLADAEATITTNLLGPIRLTDALVEHLSAQPDAALINVTSGLAFVPMPRAATYSATKAALHSYTISLRERLRGVVEVIEIIPPAVQTELTPGQSTREGYLPLATFIDQVMAQFETGEPPAEVCVPNTLVLRNAEKEGRLADALALTSRFCGSTPGWRLPAGASPPRCNWANKKGRGSINFRAPGFGWLGAQLAGSSLSPAIRCIAFCSFSKARTSIWRMRSRLTS
jgi:uncharacterized oxidoreductase